MRKYVIKMTPLFLLMVVLLFSCPAIGNKRITIDTIYWVIENIDPGYWISDTPDASCFFKFTISYEESDITYSDIDSVVISDPTMSWFWNIKPDVSDVDTENKKIGSFLIYSGQLSSNGSLMMLGTYTFEVRLTNGTRSTCQFTVPAPDSTTQDGYNLVYTEEYTGTIESNYVSAISRATVSDCTKDTSNNILVDFSVTDPRVYSGYLWFYNSQDDYLGRSEYFRYYDTGALTSVINGGANFHTDGTSNIVTVNENDINFQTGYSFSDISKVIVVLTDGYQYDGTEQTYDCRATSDRYVLSVN